MVIFLVFLVYIQQDILIITGLQASGVIIDRLLQKCCFVWSEIVGPYSSGNFNDWPLKLKAGSKIWVVVTGIQQDIYIHISPWDALSQVHKAVTDFFPIIRLFCETQSLVPCLIDLSPPWTRELPFKYSSVLSYCHVIGKAMLVEKYPKIPKISPGAYIFQRGLCTEGNLRLKIDWAIL